MWYGASFANVIFHSRFIFINEIFEEETPSDFLRQGSSINGIWPAEQRQYAEQIYYIFFKFHFSVLTIYIFIFIINERLFFSKIVEPTTLQLKVIVSTKAPPRPTL